MRKIKAFALLCLAKFGLFVMKQKPDDEEYTFQDVQDILKFEKMRDNARKILNEKNN